MSGERIILDPAEVATGRTELDISAWVGQSGVNWGDAEVEAYRASGVYGDTVIDYRVPSRQVTLPLMLKAVGGTAFATIRELIQAKAALAQAEGMWLKRVTSSGGTFFADVQMAGLSLSGGWMQAHKDADTEAELRLECSPDFYGAETTLADHTETSAAELVFTETSIDGNYPARVRVVVDEDQGQSQIGLMWGFRSRHYSSASTARLAYEAEALQPLDTAAAAALSGASGGTVVTHGTLATNWTPVLGTNMGGTAFLTHTGTYRWWCRYRTTSGTAVALRGVYDVGDLTYPVENAPWYHSSAGTALHIADLGELRLDQGPVGTHRWQGMVQAIGAAGGENVSIDRVWFQPVDESAGVLRAPLNADSGLATYSTRDAFDQLAGALTGKVAQIGGTWTVVTGSGATDFQVETTGKTAQQTGTNNTRLVSLGTTNYTDIVVQTDIKFAYTASVQQLGVFARCDGAAIANAFQALVSVIGSSASIGAGVPVIDTKSIPAPAANSWYTLRAVVYSTGAFVVWLFPRGSASGAPVYVGYDVALATGGARATGRIGLYDFNGATAATRNYDNFAAWVPVTDAVLHPSQSAELRTDGMVREDSTGTAYGPVSWVEGDLPRLPVSGPEGRTVEVFLKASRGDFGALPDTGIDNISARAYARPCWLTVPGA